MDDQQRAREFLPADATGNAYEFMGEEKVVPLPVVLDAITAALRAAPEGFVMVKASALDGIRTAAEACWAQSQDKSFAEWVRDDAKGQARGLRAALAMLATRPQGVK